MRFHIKTILAKLLKEIRVNKLPFVLLALACFLRFYDISGHATFLGDQGRDAIIIRRILTLEHFPAIGAPTSIGMVYLGPFYYYFIAPWLLLFNYNPLGLAIGVAFISVLSAALAYFLIAKQNGKLTAFFFLFLLTFSASNIMLSRFSWNPNLLPIFTFFTLYAFSQMLTGKSWVPAFLFGSLFSLSLQLHYLAALILPVFIIFTVWQIIRDKKLWPMFWKLLVSLCGFSLFSLPLFIFDLRHDFLNSRNFLKLFTQTGVTATGSFWQRFGETVNNFFWHVLQMDLGNTFSVIFFLLLMIIFVKFGRQTKNLFYWICFYSVLIFMLGFSFMNSGRFEHYYTPIYYAFFLNLASIFTIRFQSCRICQKLIVVFLIFYLAANFGKFKVIFTPGSNQISHSQKVANFLSRKINNQPYNMATWPVQFTEDNYEYFLEIKNHRVADRRKIEITEQMFVLCNQEPCLVTDSPSWNISMFGPAKIAKIWNSEGIKIYKLVHNR